MTPDLEWAPNPMACVCKKQAEAGLEQQGSGKRTR